MSKQIRHVGEGSMTERVATAIWLHGEFFVVFVFVFVLCVVDMMTQTRNGNTV